MQSRYWHVGRHTLTILLGILLLGPSTARAQQRFQLPDNVIRRSVDIWSEGTRMAGDIYAPAAMNEDDRLPTILMSHGWGATKASLARNASRFAAEGYLVLAFDYRGWGESDGKLVVQGRMPERDADGIVTVRAQEIRSVIDPVDQTLDIVRAFDFIEGEPNADTARLGYWGTSYSGAHAVWVSANEPRAVCAVGQVAAANSLSLSQVSWGDVDIVSYAHSQAIRRARGEIGLPQGTDKAPNLNGWTHLDKVIGYNPVDDASRITIPLLVIDAENEELFDRHQAGELAILRARLNGAPAQYTVLPGITHYQVYSGDAYELATQMAVDWFAGCFK